MQANIHIKATGIRAERSDHKLPEYLGIAVALTVASGSYPYEIAIKMNPDEARALSEQLLAAAQQAERDCEAA